MKKRCAECGKEKAISFFNSTQWNRGEGYGKCRECLSTRTTTKKQSAATWRKNMAALFEGAK